MGRDQKRQKSSRDPHSRAVSQRGESEGVPLHNPRLKEDPLLESWRARSGVIETTSTHLWTIKNFSDSCAAPGVCLKSSRFATGNDLRWSLKCFPKGRDRTYRDYISLFLVLDYVAPASNQDFGDDCVMATFQISLLDSKGRKRMKGVVNSPRRFAGSKDQWGWSRYIERGTVLEMKNDFLHNDTLALLLELTVLEPGAFPMQKVNLPAKLHAAEVWEKERISIEDFSQLSSPPQPADCIVKVSTTEFRVHRRYLCERSSVFAALFGLDTKKKRSYTKVTVKESDPSTVRAILYFIYTQRLPDSANISIDAFYKEAEKYQIKGLSNPTALEVGGTAIQPDLANTQRSSENPETPCALHFTTPNRNSYEIIEKCDTSISVHNELSAYQPMNHRSIQEWLEFCNPFSQEALAGNSRGIGEEKEKVSPARKPPPIPPRPPQHFSSEPDKEETPDPPAEFRDQQKNLMAQLAKDATESQRQMLARVPPRPTFKPPPPPIVTTSSQHFAEQNLEDTIHTIERFSPQIWNPASEEGVEEQELSKPSDSSQTESQSLKSGSTEPLLIDFNDSISSLEVSTRNNPFEPIQLDPVFPSELSRSMTGSNTAISKESENISEVLKSASDTHMNSPEWFDHTDCLHKGLSCYAFFKSKSSKISDSKNEERTSDLDDSPSELSSEGSGGNHNTLLPSPPPFHELGESTLNGGAPSYRAEQDREFSSLYVFHDQVFGKLVDVDSGIRGPSRINVDG